MSPLEGASDGAASSIEEAWSELARERSVRERCYEKWVADGKLPWADARDRYARIIKAEAFLKALCDLSATDKAALIDKGVPF